MRNASLEKALYYIAGNGNFHSVSIEDLEKVTNDYPYFSVSHLLLATKLKTEHQPGYEKQVQKTALFFPNVNWLHYQMSNDVLRLPVVHYRDEKENEMQAVAPGIDPVDLAQTEISDTTVSSQTGTIDDEITGDEEIRSPNIEGEIETPVIPITTEFTEEEIVQSDELAHESLEETGEPYSMMEPREEIENQEITESADVPITTEFTEEEIVQSDELAHESLQETGEPFTMMEPGEEIDHPAEVLENDENSDSKEGSAYENTFENTSAEAALQTEEEMAAVTAEGGEEVEAFLTEAESTDKDDTGEEESEKAEEIVLAEPEELDEHETMFRNIKAMLDASADEAGQDANNAAVPIDPYHTIDYFASQGIKLELETNPQDPLGKQLKKFTHWLKHMKKLGPEDALEEINRTGNEEEIQDIANSSNTVKEVVTEAMALVLAKQGKREKAIQLYEKLSFLNPDKSTYFADQIKNLKNT